MRTKEQIILDMCYTWRHDYGLDKMEHDSAGGYVSVGLTNEERKILYNSMKQLYENCIEPYIEIKL